MHLGEEMLCICEKYSYHPETLPSWDDTTAFFKVPGTSVIQVNGAAGFIRLNVPLYPLTE